MKTHKRLGVLMSLAILLVAVLFTAGCSDLGDTTVSVTTGATEQSSGPISTIDRPTVTTPVTTDIASDAVDPRAQLIELGQTYTEHISGGTAYPDNSKLYALVAPSGSRLQIGISGFDVDLDIYVDTDLSLLDYDDHGTWQSNAYGTVDEEVSIGNPSGVYYIQVCSYEAVESDFTLYSVFTP
jgi:hypothetical protein